jgi:peptidoglycan/xylan/chitin deacetylase (PgdA/CDA1 family)
MKKILLSFDIEEFDMPLEYGKSITFEDQIRVSTEGAHTILDILETHDIRATFFSTVVFATHAPSVIDRINKAHHELASHGYYHSQFEAAHLAQSKTALEALSGKPVTGFRMARMMPVDDAAIAAAGYTYNSSLNPVYLPGRYNNFFKPRTLVKTGALQQLPASAVPLIRFPLFWLSFHNLPLWLYQAASAATVARDGYLNIYFHPWEFTPLDNPAYGFPGYIVRNTGVQMQERFDALIRWGKKKGYGFETIGQFLTDKKFQISDSKFQK